MNIATPETLAPDLIAIKSKQKATWSSGNYAAVGTTVQIVGENLAEAMDLRPDARVLDVAAGNGNATLAAARRSCEVVSTDYVSSLLRGGAARAEAEQLTVAFREADAEDLPFDASSFDHVMSTFGVMFAADQDTAADEMLRVRIGRPKASLVKCSAQLAATSRRLLVFILRWNGAQKGVCRNYSAIKRRGSISKSVISHSVCGLRNIGWSIGARFTGRCTRLLPL